MNLNNKIALTLILITFLSVLKHYLMKTIQSNTNKITVEINSTSGAFCFKQFNSLKLAEFFCNRLRINSTTLTGIIKF